jgi:hypothetical protein
MHDLDQSGQLTRELECWTMQAGPFRDSYAPPSEGGTRVHKSPADRRIRV